MSNYLLVVSDCSRSVQIKDWLESYVSSQVDEIVRFEIAHDRWLTYVSRRPSSELREGARAIFKGYAIDYSRKSIVFGAQGLSDYVAKHGSQLHASTSLEGCYISACWDDRKVDVSTDAFSLCPMLYSAATGMVAVSDSSYVLVQLRKALGLPCSLDEQAAIARSWGNAMAGQMLSEDGFINEVKFAHVGVSLRIGFESDVTLEVLRRSVLDEFQVQETSYPKAVRSSAVQIASVLNSLASISLNSAYFSLSGGMDSRVCLAAALLGEKGREKSAFNCINTNASHSRDFQVVDSLSKKFGFHLGLRDDPASQETVRVKSASKLGNWYLSNAGIYDFLYVSPAAAEITRRVSVGGHGAELHKGNYGWRQIGTIAKAIEDNSIAVAFREQCEKGILAMGLEPSNKFGSEWHYLGFRNAIHSGRFVTATMTGLRPLMTRDLVALSRSDLNEWIAPKKGGQSLISDLLISLSPELATHPFDDAKKDMTLSDVLARSQYLGGPLSAGELETYSIHGELASVVNGAPQLFIAIVKADGKNLGLDRESLRPLIEASFARLSGRMRDVYASTHAEAQNKLNDTSLAISQMRASIGKLLSLGLID